MANKKAPGPDGIPTEVIKVLAEEYPYVLLNMFNACLQVGIFSSRWKMQRLVLFDKGKGPPITPSSYRPLCLLDNTGKVLIRARLRTAIESAGGLAENQYGFWVGRSTVGAIREVLEAPEKAWCRNNRAKSVCVLVTLHVKNAFNSVKWVDILDALEKGFRVPTYIRRIIDDHMNNRRLLMIQRRAHAVRAPLQE